MLRQGLREVVHRYGDDRPRAGEQRPRARAPLRTRSSVYQGSSPMRRRRVRSKATRSPRRKGAAEVTPTRPMPNSRAHGLQDLFRVHRSALG